MGRREHDVFGFDVAVHKVQTVHYCHVPVKVPFVYRKIYATTAEFHGELYAISIHEEIEAAAGLNFGSNLGY